MQLPSARSEDRRIAALHGLAVLDTPPDRAYDDVVAVASALFAAPIALVSLVDADRQWFKARVGLDVCETGREVSFCSRAIARDDLETVFVVPDATADPAFRDNPLVTGPPHVRFYAGAPLVTLTGDAIGSLCVIDTVPRDPTPAQLHALTVLARGVVAQLELRRTVGELRERDDLHRLLVDACPDAVVTADASGRITGWNPAADALFGRAAVEAVGRPLTELVARPCPPAEGECHDHGSPVEPLVGDDLRDGTARQTEATLAGAGGRAFPAEVSVTPLRATGGRSYSVVVRDLTVRRRAEAERRESETRDVVIYAMARLAESRDTDTGAHIDRVRAYCQALARELMAGRADPQVDAEFVDLIGRTSPLHDIGKVGIPDAILNKPGRLTPAEFEVMKRHAAIGAETLAAAIERFPDVRFLKIARNIAATHHERWDGTGYPAGLVGAAIPICGRIVALADVYDALTTRRVYKPAYPHAEARTMIVAGSGKHFDPAVVAAFAAVEAEFDAIRCRLTNGAAEAPVAAAAAVAPRLAA